MTIALHRCWPPLFAALALFLAFRAAADDAPAAEPPAGQLLVASEAIGDPRFFHSVVLLLRHDANGAFGIVINHPLGERALAAILADASGKNDAEKDLDSGVEGNIGVFFGGPVQPERGFVVHSADYRRADTLIVGETLAMTASKEVLRDIGRKKGPAHYLFALGYAGWGGGQLEGEIARNAWFTAPAEPGLVFDADPATIWERALARRTREL